MPQLPSVTKQLLRRTTDAQESEYEEFPEQELYFAILRKAAIDSFSPADLSARRWYWSRDFRFLAELGGFDPVAARNILVAKWEDAGLDVPDLPDDKWLRVTYKDATESGRRHRRNYFREYRRQKSSP